MKATNKPAPESMQKCPKCGLVAIRIEHQKDETTQDIVFVVACGNLACRVRRELRYPTKRADIEVYDAFVDAFTRASAPYPTKLTPEEAMKAEERYRKQIGLEAKKHTSDDSEDSDAYDDAERDHGDDMVYGDDTNDLGGPENI